MRPELPPLLPSWVVPIGCAMLLFGGISALTWILMDRHAPMARVQAVVGPRISPLYPMEAFTTTQPSRRVLFSDDEGPRNVFVGLEDNAFSVSATDSKALSQEAERTLLAKQGYAWGPEGFINASRKGDVKALFGYLKLGMDVNAQNAFGSSAVYAATEGN